MKEVKNMSKIISSVKRITVRDGRAWTLILPALLCIFLCVILPQIQAIIWSFFEMKGFTPTEFIGWENYRIVVTDTAFLRTFQNTLLYVFYSVLVGFFTPILVSLVMNEIVHFRKFTRFTIYLPTVMPAVTVSLLWYFMYYPDQTGLLNSIIVKLGGQPYVWLQDGRYNILYICISMAWTATGGTALYYYSAMQSVNRELYEAAVIDGAGVFRRLQVVTLPHMSGMLLLFFMRHIMGVFNVVEQPMQMTDGGPNNASVSLGLLSYRYAFSDGKPGYSLALSVMMSVIMVAATAIYMRVNKRVEDNL